MILITGATGFIGEQLVRRLLADGERVRILVRRPEKARALFGPLVDRLELVVGDVAERASLDRATAGVSAVYHLASLIAYKGDWEHIYGVNVRGTQHLLEACLAAGVRRVVHLSSIAAGGPAVMGPDGALRTRSEADQPAPLSDPYGRTKLAQEEEALAYGARGLEVVVLRPSAVFGPGDRGGVNTLLRLVKGRRLPFYLGSKATPVNLVYVGDVVEGSILAMARGRAGEVYNLVGPNTTHEELFALLAAVSGGRIPSFAMPTWVLRTVAGIVAGVTGLFGRPPLHPNDIQSWTSPWLCDGTKATAELGLRLTEPEAAWAATLRWIDSTTAVGDSR